MSRVYGADELKKAVECLAFETHHFRCYSKLYADRTLHRVSPAASQAVSYCLLLHLRVLIGFFYSPPTQDDCCAEHFAVLPGFRQAFPSEIHAPTDRTKEVAKKLNKLLAHFSAYRWETRRPGMAFYKEFGQTILGLIERFERALPEDVREVYAERYRHWDGKHPAGVRASSVVTKKP
jgi:hypothetical protein